MTQLPPGQMNMDGLGADEARREDVVTDDILPSAGDASGLSPALRQRLDSEVQSSGANQVVANLRARIAEIDGHTLADDDPQRMATQAERALAVAQISYLEEHHGADPMTAGEQGIDGSYASAAVHDDSDLSARAVGTGDGMTTQNTSAVMRDTPDEDNRARIYDQNR